MQPNVIQKKKSVNLVSQNFKKKKKIFFLHFWKKISMKEKKFQFTITTTIIFFCILSIHYRDEKPPINSKKAYVKKIEDWIITYVKIFLNKISIHTLFTKKHPNARYLEKTHQINIDQIIFTLWWIFCNCLSQPFRSFKKDKKLISAIFNEFFWKYFHKTYISFKNIIIILKQFKGGKIMIMNA